MILNRQIINVFKDRSGASLVEMGLLLPLLVSLALGMMVYANVVYQFHVAEKGVKAASRFLARIPVAPTAGCNFSFDSASETAAKELAVKGSFDANATQLLPNWATTQVTIPATTCKNDPAGGGAQIPVVTVNASFTYNGLGLLNFLGAGSAITISASHEEVHIGG